MSVEPIYIGLGSNLPRESRSSAETIGDALDLLEREGVRTARCSSLWSSPAWPDPSKPSYVNAVAEIETRLEADRLLDLLLSLETRLGRERLQRWDSRTLDLDLIDYRGQVMERAPQLILPHPRAVKRAFVMLPLQEIAPDWTDPVSGKAIDEIIKGLKAEDVDATSKL